MVFWCCKSTNYQPVQSTHFQKRMEGPEGTQTAEVQVFFMISSYLPTDISLE